MSNNLRARIEGALTDALMAQVGTFNAVGLASHAARLTDAVMAVVDDAVYCATHYDGEFCRYCRQHMGEPHPMACRLYVGPIAHEYDDVAGDWDWDRRLIPCSCGTARRIDQEDDGCPNAAETWRGPKPEAADA